MNEYQDKFGTDFSSNKQILNEVAIIRSKGLKNEIAGYITKILQRQKKFEERKKQFVEDENKETNSKNSKKKTSIDESADNSNLKEESETNDFDKSS